MREPYLLFNELHICLELETENFLYEGHLGVEYIEPIVGIIIFGGELWVVGGFGPPLTRVSASLERV